MGTEWTLVITVTSSQLSRHKIWYIRKLGALNIGSGPTIETLNIGEAPYSVPTSLGLVFSVEPFTVIHEYYLTLVPDIDNDKRLL